MTIISNSKEVLSKQNPSEFAQEIIKVTVALFKRLQIGNVDECNCGIGNIITEHVREECQQIQNVIGWFHKRVEIVTPQKKKK